MIATTFGRLFAALAVLAASVFAADRADAQTWPTFELDLTASSIEVQSTGCAFSCVGFGGEFGTGAETFSWTPASATDQIVVEDFFVWDVSGDQPGAETYSVQTELVFSSPDQQTASSSGGGFVIQLWGDYSAGVLRWTETASVAFDQGSELEVAFEGVSGIWDGSVSTSATFMGNLIQPMGGGDGPISSVPLPDSLVLLLSALALLGGVHVARQRADTGPAAT